MRAFGKAFATGIRVWKRQTRRLDKPDSQLPRVANLRPWEGCDRAQTLVLFLKTEITGE